MGNETRRSFLLKTGLVAGAAVASNLPLETVEAAGTGGLLHSGRRAELVDTNVSLGRWPCRRLPLDETPALVGKLRGRGVKEAWASSFDGLLYKDLGAVNARLAEDCRRHGRGVLVPFGSVNPTLPSWEEDVRRCHKEHKMPGIRLHPGYHGYTLSDPRFAKLLDAAVRRGLVVQLALAMEDERTQNRLMTAPNVDATPLLTLLPSRPGLRVVVLNWFRAARAPLVAKLAAAGEVYFDVATLEGVGGVENLLKQVPGQRVVFGSHAPFFYLESALLKLKESSLSPAELVSIQSGNARRLLGVSGRKAS